MRHLRKIDSDGETQEAVNPPHPVGITLGEVVIDRDHVHTLARKRIEVGGQGCHERFALAGAHLGNLAVVHGHAADQLDVEMPHAQHASRSLATDSKGLGQEFVQ